MEGVGTAMYSTASYTLLTQMYSKKKGTLVVSGNSWECLSNQCSFTTLLLGGYRNFVETVEIIVYTNLLDVQE